MIYSIKDRANRNRFREKLRESEKGVTKFVIYFLVKPTKTNKITENIPKKLKNII